MFPIGISTAVASGLNWKGSVSTLSGYTRNCFCFFCCFFLTLYPVIKSINRAYSLFSTHIAFFPPVFLYDMALSPARVLLYFFAFLFSGSYAVCCYCCWKHNVIGYCWSVVTEQLLLYGLICVCAWTGQGEDAGPPPAANLRGVRDPLVFGAPRAVATALLRAGLQVNIFIVFIE